MANGSKVWNRWFPCRYRKWNRLNRRERERKESFQNSSWAKYGGKFSARKNFLQLFFGLDLARHLLRIAQFMPTQSWHEDCWGKNLRKSLIFKDLQRRGPQRNPLIFNELCVKAQNYPSQVYFLFFFLVKKNYFKSQVFYLILAES